MSGFAKFDDLQGGESALHLAARTEYEGKDKMIILLEHGADVNMQTLGIVSNLFPIPRPFSMQQVG